MSESGRRRYGSASPGCAQLTASDDFGHVAPQPSVTMSQRTPATKPPGLLGHTMAYDAVRRRVVLFGGLDLNTVTSDTWLWDGTTWSQAATPARPTPHWLHAMSYDSDRDRMVTYGG